VEAGVFGYLVKPFRETDLLPAIQTARARHAVAAAVTCPVLTSPDSAVLAMRKRLI